MSAIAHGWQPEHPTHKLPPLAVAKEWHTADKKVGKFEHPVHKATGGPLGNEVTFDVGGAVGYPGYYGGGTTGNTAYFGEGGKVEALGKVLDFLDRGRATLMNRIEGAFHNPYTADPDELRALISKYWGITPEAPVAPRVAPEEPPGHASGGAVAAEAPSHQGFLDAITSAVDRASIGLLSQWMGEKNGKAAWTTDPGLLEEAKAMPDYMLGLEHSALDLGAPFAATAAHVVPVPLFTGLASVLGASKDHLDRYWAQHGNPAPAWSRDAAQKVGAIQRAVEASQGKGDPRGFLENAAQMGGTLLGQIPLVDLGAAGDAAADSSKAGTLGRLLGNDLLEWTTPAIRPSMMNYTSGALLGGLSGLGGATPSDRSAP